jgi:hypothetical protein
LPDPVGAAMSVSTPEAINGQPWACGSVGPSGKRRRNHSATAGWNRWAVPAIGTGSHPTNGNGGAKVILGIVGRAGDSGRADRHDRQGGPRWRRADGMSEGTLSGAMTERRPVPDDIIERLRTVCLALPEVDEEAAWVGTRWTVRRRNFAHVLTVDTTGGHPPTPGSPVPTGRSRC